jgi:phenylacetate-CoA ligase
VVEVTYNYPRVAYYLECLLRHTHWNQWQVEDYQNKKLRAIVKYAYENVKFYHEKLDHTGLKPDDIKTVSDLKKLPMVKRDELQNSSEQLISKQFRIDRLKSVSTSGSSGKPLMTYLTKTEDEFRKAKLLRPHVVCGQKPWDKWVLIEAIQNMDHVGQLQRLFNFYTPVFVSVSMIQQNRLGR